MNSDAIRMILSFAARLARGVSAEPVGGWPKTTPKSVIRSDQHMTEDLRGMVGLLRDAHDDLRDRKKVLDKLVLGLRSILARETFATSQGLDHNATKVLIDIERLVEEVPSDA